MQAQPELNSADLPGWVRLWTLALGIPELSSAEDSRGEPAVLPLVARDVIDPGDNIVSEGLHDANDLVPWRMRRSSTS